MLIAVSKSYVVAETASLCLLPTTYAVAKYMIVEGMQFKIAQIYMFRLVISWEIYIIENNNNLRVVNQTIKCIHSPLGWIVVFMFDVSRFNS